MRWLPWRDNLGNKQRLSQKIFVMMLVVAATVSLVLLKQAFDISMLIAGFIVLGLGPSTILLSSWRRAQRQWRLLQDGQPRRARIKRIATNLRANEGGPLWITYVHRDLNGRKRLATERFFRDELGGDLREGMELDVLVHPELSEVVAPFLYGASFAEQAPMLTGQDEDVEPRLLEAVQAEDLRPARVNVDAMASFDPLPFVASLHDVAPRGGIRAWWLRWWGRGVIGMLSVDESGLHCDFEGRITSLPWSCPWAVHMTVRLLQDARAELNLTLRLIDSDVPVRGKDEIRFKVELDQRCLCRSLPIKWETCPYIGAEDFVQIWPLIRAHGPLHGQPDLTGVSLSQGALMPERLLTE